MSTHDFDVDRIALGWLADGPTELSDRVLEASLAQIHHTPQRRALRVPWRFHDMPSVFKLALAAAAVVAVLVVGSGFLMRAPTANVGGSGIPTPSPASGASPSPASGASPSPTALPSASTNPLLDTSTWTTYASDRYGFTIDHPSDWVANPDGPPDHDWTLESDAEAWDSTAPEKFVSRERSIAASAWSFAVAPGTTVESWMELYCVELNADRCPYVTDGAVPIETGDQHRGLAQYGPNMDTIAFILDGETMYVVGIWRGETDPAVRPYGGARRLLEAFVSTMTIGAGTPQGSPSAG